MVGTVIGEGKSLIGATSSNMKTLTVALIKTRKVSNIELHDGYEAPRVQKSIGTLKKMIFGVH